MTRENLSSGFPTKRDSNQPDQLQRLARIEISLLGSLDMILSNMCIIKALIRLCIRAGWSVSLLFTKPPKTCVLAYT